MKFSQIRAELEVHCGPVGPKLQEAWEGVVDLKRLDEATFDALIAIPLQSYVDAARHFVAMYHFSYGPQKLLPSDSVHPDLDRIVVYSPNVRHRLFIRGDNRTHSVLRHAALYDITAFYCMLTAWRALSMNKEAAQSWLQLAHRFQHINNLLPGMPNVAVEHLECALELLFGLPEDTVKLYKPIEEPPPPPTVEEKPLGFFEAWKLSFWQLWGGSGLCSAGADCLKMLWDGFIEILTGLLCLVVWLFGCPYAVIRWLIWRPAYNAAFRRDNIRQAIRDGAIKR